jgi:hypothetical protein
MYPGIFLVTATGQCSLSSLCVANTETSAHNNNKVDEWCYTGDAALCRARNIENRKRRLQFIKVLLGILLKAGETAIYQQAKAIVSTCAAARRRRDPRIISFSLPSTVELLLRDVVGGLYWRRAEIYTQWYISHLLQPQQLLERQREQLTVIAEQTPLERLLSGGYEDL